VVEVEGIVEMDIKVVEAVQVVLEKVETLQ
jgi:hypothetical protein